MKIFYAILTAILLVPAILAAGQKAPLGKDLQKLINQQQPENQKKKQEKAERLYYLETESGELSCKNK
ncbi:MAG: hypothetical protein ABFR97_11255 [Thermodesulfobacteriota bacterium]